MAILVASPSLLDAELTHTHGNSAMVNALCRLAEQAQLVRLEVEASAMKTLGRC